MIIQSIKITKSLSTLLIRSLSSNSRIIVKSKLPLENVKKSVPKFLLDKFNKKEISNKTAILDGITGRELTYLQLYESTYKFASALKKLGIKKGSCIAIMSPNHVHYFTSFHGIALTGAMSTTVNPLYTIDELIYQLTITKAKLIIAHPFCLGKYHIFTCHYRYFSLS